MNLVVNSSDFPVAYHTRTPHFRRIVVPRDAPMAHVVEMIIQTSNVHGTIDRIEINSHGNAGYVDIGEGLHIDNVHLLSRLRPYFRPMVSGEERTINTGILIDACLVARNEEVNISPVFMGLYVSGEEFLLRMAIEINNKVYASTNIQRGPNGRDTSSFEGGYIIFGPTGILKRVGPAQTRNHRAS